MLYKKIYYVSLAIYATVNTFTSGATYYAYTNNLNGCAPAGTNDRCVFLCDKQDWKSDFDCGNAGICDITCDQKQCLMGGTITATHSSQLNVISRDEQKCFKKTAFHLPETGSAQFSATSNSNNPFQEMIVNAGSNTKSIWIDCSHSGICNKMTVNAQTAEFLFIDVAGSALSGPVIIHCPQNVATFNYRPYEAPCYIDAWNKATLSGVTIDTLLGMPHDVYIKVDDTTNWDLIALTCAGIDNQISVDETTMLNPNQNQCWNTRAPTISPTNHPTSTPTLNPTEATRNPSNNPTNHSTEATTDPTAIPTHAPTMNPTSSPSNDPTKHPSFQPSIPPTQYPTAEPSHPTRAPSNPPTRIPSSDPTTKSEPPTRSPSTNPSFQPSTSTPPTLGPTLEPTLETTRKATSFPTRSPAKKTTINPSLMPTVYPTINPIDMAPQPTLTLSITSHPSAYPTMTFPATSQDDEMIQSNLFAHVTDNIFHLIAIISAVIVLCVLCGLCRFWYRHNVRRKQIHHDQPTITHMMSSNTADDIDLVRMVSSDTATQWNLHTISDEEASSDEMASKERQRGSKKQTHIQMHSKQSERNIRKVTSNDTTILELLEPSESHALPVLSMDDVLFMSVINKEPNLAKIKSNDSAALEGMFAKRQITNSVPGAGMEDISFLSTQHANNDEPNLRKLTSNDSVGLEGMYVKRGEGATNSTTGHELDDISFLNLSSAVADIEAEKRTSAAGSTEQTQQSNLVLRNTRDSGE